MNLANPLRNLADWRIVCNLLAFTIIGAGPTLALCRQYQPEIRDGPIAEGSIMTKLGSPRFTPGGPGVGENRWEGKDYKIEIQARADTRLRREAYGEHASNVA